MNTQLEFTPGQTVYTKFGGVYKFVHETDEWIIVTNDYGVQRLARKGFEGDDPYCFVNEIDALRAEESNLAKNLESVREKIRALGESQ